MAKRARQKNRSLLWTVIGLLIVVGYISSFFDHSKSSPVHATATVVKPPGGATVPPPTSSSGTGSTTPSGDTTQTTISIPATTPPSIGAAPASNASDLVALNGLPTVTLDFQHHYQRVQDFGPAWTDDNDDLYGHNGCGTRDDILAHALSDIVYRAGTRNCVVLSGTLQDPYSGTTIAFSKSHATVIQIDHIVPLHAAWQLGAWQWTQTERIDYANDPTVLVAVSGALNEAKGDDLANEWLPPNMGYRCTYAQRTVAIHVKYALPVTAGEKATLTGILNSCA